METPSRRFGANGVLLERHFRSERNLPHCGAVGDVANAGAVAAIHATVRQVKIHVIENVEELKLQFSPDRLGDGNGFKQ